MPVTSLLFCSFKDIKVLIFVNYYVLQCLGQDVCIKVLSLTRGLRRNDYNCKVDNGVHSIDFYTDWN